MCCLAHTTDGPPHRNNSLIVEPLNSKGVHIEKKIRKNGMHSSDTEQIFFDDVRVPLRTLIGEEGQGVTYQMLQFQQ
ncbi:acyl-CoA dehydrogenase, partial [Burkholderia pseudomallei]